MDSSVAETMVHLRVGPTTTETETETGAGTVHPGKRKTKKEQIEQFLFETDKTQIIRYLMSW